MGLITKAVDKVENTEEPAVIPEAPPPPEEPTRKGKKRLLLLMAPLALILVTSTLGYFLFLKPTPEAPPEATRRSIGVRKKMAGPPATPAKKIADSDAAEAGTAGESETPKQVSQESTLPRQPAQRAGAASKTGEKPSKSKAQVPVGETGNRSPGPQKQLESKPLPSETGGPLETLKTTSGDQSPNEGAAAEDADDKRTTPAPHIEQSAEAVLGPLPKRVDLPDDAQEALELEDAGLPPATAAPAESGPQDPEVDVTEEAGTQSFDEAPALEITPAQRSEPAEIRTEKPLMVSDRSDSRAESYYKKGVSYQQEGELTKAIDSYRRALNFNPDHLQANMNLATAYLKAGRYKQAEKI